MNADDSARLRDLLASDRTLLAYIRTALGFSGLGFAVARFGIFAGRVHYARYLGTFMVVLGLLVTIIGFVQHRAVVRQVGPPSQGPATPAPYRSLHIAATAGAALVCALLAIYLATNAG